MTVQPTQQAQRPTHHPITPIGTSAELERFGFDKRVYGSCSPRLIAGGTMANLGCPEYAECKYRHKDVSGPENRVYRHIKNIDVILLREAPCYACLAAKRSIEGRGEIFEDLGGPGTSYTMSISVRESQARLEEWVREQQEAENEKAEKAGRPPKQVVEKDAPPELREAARLARVAQSPEPYVSWSRAYTCNPFPRPNQNPLLRESMVAHEHRASMRRELIDRRKARISGLSVEEVDPDVDGPPAAGG